MPDEQQVRHRVGRRLVRELNDDALASAVADQLDDRAIDVLATQADLDTSDLLAFAAPVQRAPEALVVFAFGNRLVDDVGLLPGPVNVELASLADAWVRATGLPVVAQWEVADEMAEAVHRVGWVEEADGAIRYLSTAGVAEQVRSFVEIERVGVLAMADHAARCCSVMARAGFDSGVVPDVILPTTYDPESGQPWTRDRASYLAVDVLARCLTLAPPTT